ncbi:Diaminopimelate epimerase-like protein [Aspergillus steynii IBT 23096]|uniref:Diaminopimelate epimerase-like protein n=1 Tax=Aspergillus steynii IBT 23096 TaxID=1392250 RepID=A0A2I2FUK5_9EURO|nr:Diaminopimelate epimerase-like protein [Aspergillus steynii IBT 23096]PLB44323.1 Diaminopimelate epimerase-like protein [Aspergillus steynii IBT 23096]
MPIPYFIVDVFTSTPYKGNPLAVVPALDTPLSTTEMKILARQFNLSETTFICPPTVSNATYRLRSFLPNGEEVFGAGHNALGAWWYIARSGLLGGDADGQTGVYHQQLGDDLFPVEIVASGSQISEDLEIDASMKNAGKKIEISMRQAKPQFLARHPDPAALSAALGLDPSEIGFHAPGAESPSGSGSGPFVCEARVVATSPARHLLVPVRDVHVLRRVRFSSEAVATELEKTQSYNSGVYVFAPLLTSASVDKDEKNESDVVPRFQARFFSPGMGVEDPATGSAAGPLGVYVWENGVVSSGYSREHGKEIHVEIVQGRQRGRESVIRVGLELEERGAVGVVIRGTGALVAKGEMVVPGEEIEF